MTAILIYFAVGVSVATGALACMFSAERVFSVRGPSKWSVALFCIFAWPMVVLMVAGDLTSGGE